MKKIICLSGKQYCGKDTIAKLLLEELPSFRRVGIGDAIKIEYGRQHNLTYEEIDANKGIYRTGLIELGNYGRSLDPDYWLKKIIEMECDIIVPDVRLIHEAEIFKNAGAYLIRVEASQEARSLRGVITNANDTTECELDSYSAWNYVISNESDYDTLKKNVKPLIEAIKSNFKI